MALVRIGVGHDAKEKVVPSDGRLAIGREDFKMIGDNERLWSREQLRFTKTLQIYVEVVGKNTTLYAPPGLCEKDATELRNDESVTALPVGSMMWCYVPGPSGLKVPIEIIAAPAVNPDAKQEEQEDALTAQNPQSPAARDSQSQVVVSRQLRSTQPMLVGGSDDAFAEAMCTVKRALEAEDYVSATNIVESLEDQLLLRMLKTKQRGDHTLLQVAAIEGEREFGASLLRLATKVGKCEDCLNACDSDGDNALHSAAQNGHDELVELLLGNGADVNALNKRSGFTPVFKAVADHGMPTTVKMLVEAAADLSHVCKQGFNALHWSIDKSTHTARLEASVSEEDAQQIVKIATVLLEKRPELVSDDCPHGGDPLVWLLVRAQNFVRLSSVEQIAALLINHGANPRKHSRLLREHKDSKTQLHGVSSAAGFATKEGIHLKQLLKRKLEVETTRAESQGASSQGASSLGASSQGASSQGASSSTASVVRAASSAAEPPQPGLPHASPVKLPGAQAGSSSSSQLEANRYQASDSAAAELLKQLRTLIVPEVESLSATQWEQQICAKEYHLDSGHLFHIADIELGRLRMRASEQCAGLLVRLQRHEVGMRCCKEEASVMGTSRTGRKSVKVCTYSTAGSSSSKSDAVPSQSCTLEANLNAFLHEQHAGAVHPDLAVVPICDDDPRTELHGQSKVILQRGQLEPLDVLGIYSGKMTKATASEERVPILDIGRVNTFAYQFDTSKGSIINQLPELETTLNVQPYPKYGNKLMAVNDCKGSGAHANCKFIEFFYLGFPAVAKIVTRPVHAGDELMTSYGDNFWMKQKVLDDVYKEQMQRFQTLALPLLNELAGKVSLRPNGEAERGNVERLME